MPRPPSLLLALLASVAALAAVPLPAQRVTLPALPLGARVRVDVTAPPLHRAVRYVAGRRGDALLLTRAPEHPLRPPVRDTLAVRLPDLARLEVIEGRGAGAYRGAWIGALIGALAGGVAGYQGRTEDSSFCWYQWQCIPRDHRVVLGAGVGGGAGALFGAAAGALVYGERWTRLLPRPAGAAAPR